MSRQLPDEDQVRQIMAELLSAAQHGGRRPTVTAVEKCLGVTHATFYRNYPELILWFRQQAATLAPNPDAPRRNGSDTDQTLARLRRENGDLRRTVKIYAEAIRQLTLDNEQLYTQVKANAKVVDLAARRDQARGADENQR